MRRGRRARSGAAAERPTPRHEESWTAGRPTFDAGLRDRLAQRRRSATRRSCRTGAGHDAGILPPPASRPRCCSSATRPASPTPPPSTPSRATAWPGVEALADGDGRPGARTDDAVLVRARLARRRTWLAPASRIAVDGGRITAVTAGRRPGARRRTGCAGVVLPGPRERALATPSTGRCAAAPTTAAARSGPGASGCTPSPARLDPDTLPGAGPRRRTPRWRWPGSPRSASSTTCTTRPAARPYADPNAMGDGADRRPRPTPASGSPCSTPATSPAGWTAPVTCRWTACSGGSPTATPTPGPSASALLRRADRTRGSARRCTPCGRCRATSCRPVVAAPRARPAAARAPLRAARRERGLPGRSTAARPTALLRRARRCSDRRRPRCTPRTSPTDDIGRLGATAAPTVCVCPTTERDLADGIGPSRRAARRRRAAQPGHRPARRRSTCSRRRARRAGRAAASAASAAASGRPSCCDAATVDGHRGPGLARRRPARGRARGPTSSPSGWTRARTAGGAPGQVVLRRHGGRCRTPWWSTDGVVVARRRSTCWATSGELLADAIEPLWEDA